MRTADLRRRLEVLNELGMLHALLGERPLSALQVAALFIPPFRERLRDGSLGPEYGHVAPSSAWRHWRASRAAGSLWDAEQAIRSRMQGRPLAPAPPAAPQLELDVFLSRHGHELTAREGEVASLRWRDKQRPLTIAKRTSLPTKEVDRLLRSVLAKFGAALERRRGA